MFYPEDENKINWDIYITVILVFTCLSTPYLISFEGADNIEWKVMNYFIDSCFLIDIVFNFNNSYYDEDFILIDKRKDIAKNYI